MNVQVARKINIREKDGAMNVGRKFDEAMDRSGKTSSASDRTAKTAEGESVVEKEKGRMFGGKVEDKIKNFEIGPVRVLSSREKSRDGHYSVRDGQIITKDGLDFQGDTQNFQSDGPMFERDGQKPARDGHNSTRDGQNSTGSGQSSTRDGRDSSRDGESAAKTGQNLEQDDSKQTIPVGKHLRNTIQTIGSSGVQSVANACAPSEDAIERNAEGFRKWVNLKPIGRRKSRKEKIGGATESDKHGSNSEAASNSEPANNSVDHNETNAAINYGAANNSVVQNETVAAINSGAANSSIAAKDSSGPSAATVPSSVVAKEALPVAPNGWKRQSMKGRVTALNQRDLQKGAVQTVQAYDGGLQHGSAPSGVGVLHSKQLQQFHQQPPQQSAVRFRNQDERDAKHQKQEKQKKRKSTGFDFISSDANSRGECSGSVGAICFNRLDFLLMIL